MRLVFLIIVIVFSAGYDASAQPSAYPQLTLRKYNQQLSKAGIFPSVSLTVKNDSIATVPLQSRLPINFYSQHLGAACKMELQLEKQTKLPIRIRLGSKEQVDYLEGKFSRNR